MNWFKNLNAKPRLMISFGVLLLLTVGIGYLGISRLRSANERIRSLYQEDMRGVAVVEELAVLKNDSSRQTRDAELHMQNQAMVKADAEASKKDLQQMRRDVELAEQYFLSVEGKQALSEIQETFPVYENGVEGIWTAISAGDLASSLVRQEALAPTASQMSKAIERARQIKETLAEEKFQANIRSYESASLLIVSIVCASLLVGTLLSLIIAHEFSKPLIQAVTTLESVAAGDLTVTLDVSTQDEVGRMARALNSAVERLNETMRHVANSAAHANSSSRQLATASESIASGAQEQAVSLEETSASLEEITAAVHQSADNAQQARQLAMGSRDAATQGQQVVADAITAMSEINAASAKISDIISTIDEIAFQTNLLAVNAAVEAARAGEEGRGFAVVATEVRSLAQRSAVAAKEIKGLIQDSLRKVDAGSALVNRSGDTLQGIVGSVKRVTDIVGEIAAASSEQSAGIEQVNNAMTQMDQVTQSNSTRTEELSATAESLSERASHLMELVGAFKLDTRPRHAQEWREEVDDRAEDGLVAGQARAGRFRQLESESVVSHRW